MGEKVKKLVPELRFSEFEEPLTLEYLGKIFDFKNGINADKSQYGSGKKFIKGESRDTCKIVQHLPQKLTLTDFQKSLLAG